MNEMLREAICDYFEVGDFAEYLGLSVDQLIEEFPDEFDDALDEIKELIGWEDEKEDD